MVLIPIIYPHDCFLASSLSHSPYVCILLYLVMGQTYAWTTLLMPPKYPDAQFDLEGQTRATVDLPTPCMVWPWFGTWSSNQAPFWVKFLTLPTWCEGYCFHGSSPVRWGSLDFVSAPAPPFLAPHLLPRQDLQILCGPHIHCSRLCVPHRTPCLPKLAGAYADPVWLVSGTSEHSPGNIWDAGNKTVKQYET